MRSTALVYNKFYFVDVLNRIRTQGLDRGEGGRANSRKIMFQLIAINVMIVIMDCGILVVGFANFYIIEMTLKGVVYSIKAEARVCGTWQISPIGDHKSRVIP